MTREDLGTRLMKFETGEMSEDEIVELFQELLDTGMAWELQGGYGRMAKMLLDHGYIKENA